MSVVAFPLLRISAETTPRLREWYGRCGCPKVPGKVPIGQIWGGQARARAGRRRSGLHGIGEDGQSCTDHRASPYASAVPDKLEPGDKAPDFTLLDQEGRSFHLYGSLRERRSKHLVYFYPKADTPGCTAQACGLRDVLAQVGTTVVIGISPDPPKRQAAFDAKYKLGFPLLADEDHSVAELYGVWVERSMYGRKYMGIERSAFLIGEAGALEQVWYKISPAATAENLLQALR